MADMRSYEKLSGSYQGYSGRAFISQVTLTRPADTTQYTAGDQVAGGTASPAALNFGTCAISNGGGGLIVSAACIDLANQSTKPNLRLYLFNGSPTLNGDNSAWLPSNADLQNLLPGGEINFSSWVIGGTSSGTAGNCFAQQTGLNIPYRCASGQANLWGALVERGTYTPVASEGLTIRLGLIHD